MRHRGIALILVLIIVFTLLVIATPFVMSMMLQERQSTVAQRQVEAYVHAHSTTNRAMYELFRTHDHYERQFRTSPNYPYFFDVPDEFRIPVRSEEGLIRGIDIECEQGKINLLTAPPHVMSTVTRIGSTSAIDPRSFTTLYSVREVRWAFPQRLRAVSQDGSAFTCDNWARYGQGARLRMMSPGMSRPFYCEVEGLEFDQNGNPWGVRTNPSPPNDTNAIVEVEVRHAVNINTATREALICVFEGLTVPQPPQIDMANSIDRVEAEALATAVFARVRAGQPFRSVLDFAAWIAMNNRLSPLQRAAIIINAFDPTCIAMLGTGTMPFCVKSFEIFTVNSSVCVTDPQKTQVGIKYFRDVVEVSPPVPLSHRLESQYDFERMFGYRIQVPSEIGDAVRGSPELSRFFSSRIDPNTGAATSTELVLTGFPYGNRIQNFSETDLTAPGYYNLEPNDAYVQGRTARDRRGRFQQPQDPVRGLNVIFREHFDSTLEGLKDGTWTIAATQVLRSCQVGNNRLLPDIAAGGCEFWIRFDEVPPDGAPLFTVQEDSRRNRLTLQWTNNELQLTAADEGILTGQISGGYARFRVPFRPERDVWYHIGIYWKGTKYGHLMMLVDGFAHPQAIAEHYNHNNQKVCTRLSQPLDAPDPQNPVSPLSLEDDSWIPDPVSPNETVALEIGREVVLYSKTTRQAIRGARGTQGYAHPANVRVSIFGYSSLLEQVDVNPQLLGATDIPQGFTVPVDRLTKNSTQTRSRFSTNLRRTLAGSINATDNEIPVVSTQGFANPQNLNTAQESSSLQNDFPSRGYVIIDQELIKYDGFGTKQVKIPESNPQAPTVTVPTLKVIQRAAIGTTAAPHTQGAQVRVSSIYVTSTADFMDPCFVQIEDEWFGPVMKDPSDPNFFVGIVQGGIPYGLNRGVAGTSVMDHAENEEVLPIFAVRDLGGSNRRNCGRYDDVTVTDGQLQRVAARIRNTATYQNRQLIGLWSAVPRDYVQDGEFVRLLKFPSDELISRSWLRAASPSVQLGPIVSTIDEIKFFAGPKSREWRLVSQMDDSSAMDTVLSGSGSMERFGGAVLAGTEIIGYAELDQQNNMIKRTRRGFLNSTREVHDSGDLIFNLAFLPLSSLRSQLDPVSGQIELNQSVEVQEQFGYVLVDNEVIFFTSNGGHTLSMPNRLRSSDGLWRGMFGTAPNSHDPWAMVYAIPYRYFDTYKPMEFDNRMSYYQASYAIPDAHWHQFNWTEENPTDVVTHAMVRVDGKVEWWDKPDARTLFDFTNPNGKNKVDFHATKDEEGRLEIRFYFEYKPGAFWPNHSWKGSPKIHNLTMTYERPWKILYHDEK